MNKKYVYVLQFSDGSPHTVYRHEETAKSYANDGMNYIKMAINEVDLS